MQTRPDPDTGTSALPPELWTERLLLRPLRREDAVAVRRLAGDREVALNTLAVPHPYEEGQAEEWIRTTHRDFQLGRAAVFAVTHQSDGLLVGTVGLVIEQDHARAELGYWVGRPFWNRGYATEACHRVLLYAFGPLRLDRVYALHFSRNPASGRVLQKLGMRHEGRLRQHYRRWGVPQDAEMYGILRHELDPGLTRP